MTSTMNGATANFWHPSGNTRHGSGGMRHALRPTIAAGIAIAGASLIVAAPVTDVQTRAVQLLDVSQEPTYHDEDLAYIMGGTGHPIPPADYLAGVEQYYIQPVCPTCLSQPLFYPASGSPLFSGVQSLTFDQSSSQGLTILNDTIMQQLNPADGNHVVVFGHSQSSTIDSELMQNFANGNTMGLGPVPSPDQLQFVMTGDPGMPNGGLLTRFPDLTFPSLGVTFTGLTPPDTDYTTNIYTLEYDGFADFPRYPINLLSDINALFGAQFVHPYQNYINPANVDQFQLMPGSAELTGVGTTNYYIAPTENLPLLDLVRNIPVVGNPLADLVQPDLKVIVNLGYGPDPDIGWSTPANVPTTFGLFPELTSQQFDTVLQDLSTGAQAGINDFIGDFTGTGPNPVSLSLDALDSSSATSSILSDPLAAFDAVAADPLTFLTNISNAFTAAAASLTSLVLPTADIAYAALVTLPTYDLNLFVSELQAGDLVDAIGLPIAANTGLGSLLAFGEIGAIENVVTAIAADFSNIIP